MKRAILLVLFFVSSVLVYPQNVFNLDDESTQSNVVGLQNATTNPSFEGMVGSLNSIHSDQYSTCFIADDYDLYCWGNREKEANGFGNSTSPTIPMKVLLLDNSTFNSVIVMQSNTCVHFTNGSVGCFGRTNYGLGNGGYSLDIGTSLKFPFGQEYIQAVSGSKNMICGITNTSGILCSGDNYRENSVHGYVTRVSGFGNGNIYNASLNLPTTNSLKQISVGVSISCALDSVGEVYCWGTRSFDCPTGISNCFTPRKISTPQNSTVVQVEVNSLGGTSDYDACLLFSNNSVGCIGNKMTSGAVLSDGIYWRSLSGVPTSLSMGQSTACAILSSGKMECWGQQFRNFNNTASSKNSEVFSLGASDNITAVTIGEFRVCITNSTGSIYCMGSNSGYSLGIGSTQANFYTWSSKQLLSLNGKKYISSSVDSDNDQLKQPFDFCPEGYSNWNYNTSADNDKDGCHDTYEDFDDDNDGFTDFVEGNCLSDSLNRSSIPADFDSDGTCDNLDADDDNDGTADQNDAFPKNSYEQLDSDNDGIGNNADNDDDNDNWLDASDDFPLDPNEWRDLDNDGMGDNADIDDDGDGWNDTMEDQCGTDRNQSSSYPSDIDGDYICDSVDSDDDGDSYLDVNDDFPNDATEWIDTDNDGTGDNADPDDDDDGTSDANDAFPLNPNEDTDTDGDGTGNNADADDDNDGTNDANDEFPLDASEVSDNDGDGIGDNADNDDDNDGWSDSDENSCVSDPLSSSITPMDFDNDGICDQMDVDDDNDGWTDMAENNCSSNPRSAASVPNDAEGDGICDADDPDDDNDGIEDTVDAFPNDRSRMVRHRR